MALISIYMKLISIRTAGMLRVPWNDAGTREIR